MYGLPISFRLDLDSEIQCISSVRSRVLGACVFEKEFERTCLMISQGECYDMETQGTEVEFYEGKLCSNAELDTNCEISERTTCVEGRDEVYFLDTCGNLANIYDSERAKDTTYWAEIMDSDLLCDVEENGPSKCGNCDYFEGSTCKKAGAGDPRPTIGEYICRDLGCEWKNEEYQHGETWCAQSGGVSEIIYDKELLDNEITEILKNQNVPGSRYFRLVCYNGEVLIEPCADYRQEICIEGEVGDFSFASCVANKWTDCLSQEIEEDCENRDERDCAWVVSETGGLCVPLYSPGFDDGVDENTCSDIGSTRCIVTFERGTQGLNIFKKSKWDSVENKQCDPSYAGFGGWVISRNMICNAIGDCGMAMNYIGEEGFYNQEDIVVTSGRLDKGELQQLLSQE
jgi:hypothetical protein